MGADTQANGYTSHTRVVNRQEHEISVILEPIGYPFSLAPGSALDFVVHSPAGDTLECHFVDGGLVVYTWSGSTVDVYSNGELLMGGGPPIPDIPQGMSMPGFMGLVFGGQEPPRTDTTPTDPNAEEG